jgi:peptidoglycan/LPS O-acetylase OafA/YrhL
MVYFNISERLGADVLLGNLFFLQTILTPTLGSNTPLWSLANEAWYYLLAPLLILACLRSTPPVRRIACALGLLAAGCFVGAGISSYFIVWLFGAGVHLLRRPLLRHSWPAWLLAGGTCIAQRLHLVPSGALFNWAADTLIGVGVALLINHWMHRSLPAGRLAKTHQVLAGFSFSLYVCHWPIGLLLVAASQRFFGFGIQLPFTLPNLCFYLGVLGVVVLFCFLFSRLTEKHTASLQARLSSWLGVASTPRPAT